MAFLAYISKHPSLGESLQFLLVGVGVVLGVLVSLAILTQLMGMLFKRMAASPAPAAATSPRMTKPAASKAGKGDEPDPALLAALIGAAVHVTLGEPHRIVSVRAVRGADQSNWSAEGRRQIFSSHRIR